MPQQLSSRVRFAVSLVVTAWGLGGCIAGSIHPASSGTDPGTPTAGTTAAGSTTTGGTGTPSPGGTGTGTTTTGGTVDPNVGFFGPSRCRSAGLAVCDGFEDTAPGGPPDPNWWTVQLFHPDSVLAVDTLRAARGQHALHVHTANGSYENAMMTISRLFPAPNNTFYGRAFVYFSQMSTQSHWTNFVASGMLPGASDRTLLRYGGRVGHLMANYIGKDEWQHGAVMVNGTWTEEVKYPSDRWTCVEWQFKGDTNEMHFWFDEVEMQHMAILGFSADCCRDVPWTAPTFDRFAMGWEKVESLDPGVSGFDIWFDEVALDYQRIRCTR